MGRIVLNETSYHGAGCIAEIATEVKGRAFKKAFICSDPDLIKFGVTAKLPHLRHPVPTILSLSAAVHQWIPPRLSVLSSRTLILLM